MVSQAPIRPENTLAELAVTRAGASRVFYRHGLDFCCHGHVSLEHACRDTSLKVEDLIEEVQREEEGSDEPFERWDDAPLTELIEHLLTRFHEPHRAELPRLIELAHKVERVHGEKPSCPRGLAEFLEHSLVELEQHMQKEEEVLFPLIRAGRGRMAVMPVQVMEQEHNDHGARLAQMRKLAHDYEPPEEACGSWRALYLGLAELERDLMQHIHLENNALFPRALRS